jgi:23S rRNA maturation mini-RNase III
MENFESKCSAVYDEYVKIYLLQKIKTQSPLNDMAANMKSLGQLSEQMANKITDMVNQELKNDKAEKEILIQIAQKYLKQFTVDVVKGVV